MKTSTNNILYQSSTLTAAETRRDAQCRFNTLFKKSKYFCNTMYIAQIFIHLSVHILYTNTYYTYIEMWRKPWDHNDMNIWSAIYYLWIRKSFISARPYLRGHFPYYIAEKPFTKSHIYLYIIELYTILCVCIDSQKFPPPIRIKL